MHKLTLGIRVRIKNNTRFSNGYSDNPMGVDGTIISLDGGGWYTVKWDNGMQNGYQDQDLELVTPVIPQKWFVRFGSPEQAVEVLKYMRKKDSSYSEYENTGKNRCFTSDNRYFAYPPNSYGYTEITFEQFEKYILNKEKITNMATEQEKRFVIGTKDVQVIVRRGSIVARGRSWDGPTLNRLVNTYSNGANTTIGGFEIRSANENLRTIRIGCTDENNVFSLKELKTILDAYNSLNK